jgi:hypothetical protein
VTPVVAAPPEAPANATKKQKKDKKGKKGGKKGKSKASGDAKRKARIEQQAARLEQRAAQLREDGKPDEAAKLEARAQRLRQSADKVKTRRGNPQNPEAERTRRKYARLKAMRKQYGKHLDKAPVQRELSLHAERSARLTRMKQLAEEHDRTDLLERILKMIDKEDQRHERHMAKPQGKDVPAEAPATTATEAAQ